MKYKLSEYSMEHMLPDTTLFHIILNDAGLKDAYRDLKDGRIVYECKEKPRNMKQAFIYWEMVD